MTTCTCFEDLEIWKKSRILVSRVYRILSENRDYGFKDQIQRAAVSIMNNISEGFERESNKDFLNFLRIAKGSCGEVRSMLYAAEDLGYLDSQAAETMRKEATVLIRQIQSLRNYLFSKP